MKSHNINLSDAGIRQIIK